MIQTLGEKLEKDEKELIEADKKEQIKGVREMPVLFEEADGVWLNLQGKDRKRRHLVELFFIFASIKMTNIYFFFYTFI